MCQNPRLIVLPCYILPGWTRECEGYGRKPKRQQSGERENVNVARHYEFMCAFVCMRVCLSGSVRASVYVNVRVSRLCEYECHCPHPHSKKAEKAEALRKAQEEKAKAEAERARSTSITHERTL